MEKLTKKSKTIHVLTHSKERMESGNQYMLADWMWGNDYKELLKIVFNGTIITELKYTLFDTKENEISNILKSYLNSEDLADIAKSFISKMLNNYMKISSVSSFYDAYSILRDLKEYLSVFQIKFDFELYNSPLDARNSLYLCGEDGFNDDEECLEDNFR